jgi:hypothetical protein
VVEPSTSVSPSTNDRSGHDSVKLLALEVAEEAEEARDVVGHLDPPVPSHAMLAVTVRPSRVVMLPVTLAPSRPDESMTLPGRSRDR